VARTKARAHSAVRIDQSNRRNDDEVLHGHMCRIENGEHRGELATFVATLTADEDGYPETARVELRRDGRIVTVPYADLTPASPADLV